ncbi:MAG: nucleotidyltransferase domain-containing protein [bacterium]|nr:nucleotidyltransferase domain-containing protein [bacterium]
MIDLPADQLEEIQEVLSRLAPECRVIAFGSRVQGRAKKFSDLDLALEGPAELTWKTLTSLKEAFAISDLPIIVDLLDLNAMKPHFRALIEAGPYEVIQEASEKTGQAHLRITNYYG